MTRFLFNLIFRMREREMHRRQQESVGMQQQANFFACKYKSYVKNYKISVRGRNSKKCELNKFFENRRIFLYTKLVVFGFFQYLFISQLCLFVFNMLILSYLSDYWNVPYYMYIYRIHGIPFVILGMRGLTHFFSFVFSWMFSHCFSLF